MKTIVYNGSSKIIKRIVHLLNRKATLPLDGQGDADWGTNGQVLTTDGNGNTSWTTPQGGGGDVTDVEVNGTSVVNAQGVAEVSVPTATSDLNNDSGFIDGTDLSTALSDYTPTSGLATVATSGSYNDLSNKPTIPAAQVNSDWNAVSGVEQILNKPTLATVATSGSYNDLTDKPTIPTVNDGTLTIQQNGTTLGTFSANQSGNTTVNLTGGGSTYTEGDGIDISAQDVISVDTTFTEASTRANIASGESLSTILGKIKKFFTDLKTVAFTGAYSDLSGTENVARKNINNFFTKDQTIDRKDGTSSAQGYSHLNVGNATPSGTDGNSSGRIGLYGFKQYYAVICSDFIDASNKSLYLPNANGTFALKEINNNFSTAQTIDAKDGTTSAIGGSWFNLGNNIPAGTAQNSRGVLRIYGSSGKYALIFDNSALTDNRNLYLPDNSGTIALTSDIKSANVTGDITVPANSSTTYDFATNSSYPSDIDRILTTEIHVSYFYGTKLAPPYVKGSATATQVIFYNATSASIKYQIQMQILYLAK